MWDKHIRHVLNLSKWMFSKWQDPPIACRCFFSGSRISLCISISQCVGFALRHPSDQEILAKDSLNIYDSAPFMKFLLCFPLFGESLGRAPRHMELMLQVQAQLFQWGAQKRFVFLRQEHCGSQILWPLNQWIGFFSENTGNHRFSHWDHGDFPLNQSIDENNANVNSCFNKVRETGSCGKANMVRSRTYGSLRSV